MRQGLLTIDRELLRRRAAHAETSAGVGPEAWVRIAVRRKMLWVVGLRPVIASLVLGTALLLETGDSSGLTAGYVVFLLGLTWTLSMVYAVGLRLTDRWPWLIDAQLMVDVSIISMLVLLTGGFESKFIPLYVLPILAGSTVRLARGGQLIAGVAALLFGVLVAAQYGLVIPEPAAWGLTIPTQALPSPRVAFYTLGLHAVGFLAVARLTGYLADNLHHTDAKLRRASSTLADLQAYNQHVIDSMTGGLAATDPHGRILMFNRAAEGISGEMATAVLGRNIAEVLQLPGELRRTLSDVVSTGRGRRAEYAFNRRSGHQMELGLSVAPLQGASGDVGYLFTFQDLTDFKREDREKERQKRLAAVGELAAGIAHEIRNPLASMAGSMQVLREELTLSSEQSQLFDIVLRESDRLNDTIRNFLAYARPSRPASGPVDVGRVLSDAAQLLKNSPDCLAGHSIDLELPATPVMCEADESQIRQIVWNLATNGLRAMPDGGRLVLAASRPSSHVAIVSVQDEGVGITPADLDRIFQPFHGGFAKGAGLGLSIVHRIVSDRGGEIRVSSQPGAGTRVDVHWPTTPAGQATVTSLAS